jgi:tungstate transport system ATP-binding protein
MRATVSDLPIVFEDVTVAVRDATVLDRVSLRLTSGAPTILLGPNGAGKTTLLRLAMGLAAPTSGHITWGARVEVDIRRRAIVFQRPVMLRRSTLANITYALAAADMPRAHRSSRAIELLGQVGLADLARRSARRLSGGEQQRLALARALARDPEILFLDEPTASLDPQGTKSVEDIVRTVAAAGVKIVMTTHDLGQARRLAGDVVFLVGGRLVEHAPADHFFTSPATPEAEAFLRGDLVM